MSEENFEESVLYELTSYDANEKMRKLVDDINIYGEVQIRAQSVFGQYYRYALPMFCLIYKFNIKRLENDSFLVKKDNGLPFSLKNEDDEA